MTFIKFLALLRHILCRMTSFELCEIVKFTFLLRVLFLWRHTHSPHLEFCRVIIKWKLRILFLSFLLHLCNLSVFFINNISFPRSSAYPPVVCRSLFLIWKQKFFWKFFSSSHVASVYDVMLHLLRHEDKIQPRENNSGEKNRASMTYRWRRWRRKSFKTPFSFNLPDTFKVDYSEPQRFLAVFTPRLLPWLLYF